MATRTSVTQTEDASGFEVAVSRDGSGQDRQEMLLTDTDGNLAAVRRDADNIPGTVTGLSTSATDTVASKTAPAGGWRFLGFVLTGDTDGRVSLTFDDVEQYAAVLSTQDRWPKLILPEPDVVASGIVVALKIKNTGATTGAYEGTLLGSLVV